MRSTVVKVLGLSIVLIIGTTILALVGPPAPFTVDDDNHVVSVVALRLGGFQVPGTEGIRPSRELFWFDPMGASRGSDARAVSTLPPFYALIAQPFALWGWRGLIGLQSLSFLLTLGLLAWIGRRRLRDPRIVWIAVATLALGAYLFEYAIALWPHMLSMALTMLAFVLASEGLGAQKERLGLRFGAGLAVGLAVGVRYQNITYAFGMGVGLLLLSSSRIRESSAFTLGLFPPLFFYALVNRARLGTLNPLTKGGGYLSLGSGEVGVVRSAIDAFLSKIIDSSMTPSWSLVNQSWWSRDPRTGALLYRGVPKKSWLQSIPWAIVPLWAMAHSLFFPEAKGTASERGDGHGEANAEGAPSAIGRAQRVDLRLSALIVLAVAGTILSFGVRRHDGICFNQRYFIDLLPLLVHGLVVTLDRLADPRPLRHLLFGALVGLLFTGAIYEYLPRMSVARHLLLLRFPLMIAIIAVGAWFFRRNHRKIVGIVVGLAIAWASVVHFAGDVRGSLELRWIHYAEGAALAGALPREGPIAVFAYWGNKDALGPLMLTRDLVVVDAHKDGGMTAPRLVKEFLRQGRRVFVITNGYGSALFARMRRGLNMIVKPPLKIPGHRRPWHLVELYRRAG